MTHVKLISFSQPPGLSKIDCMEDLVAHCARVSNPANQGKPGRELIKYLIKHKHWSPFEMVNVCLEIETTRDIARQILRHRSFSFQEFSQRYADPTDELGCEYRRARLQDTKNRQNSFENQDLRLEADFTYRQRLHWDHAYDHYEWCVENGIAKEQARVFLPEGLTLSRMYMNGTLRSWIHYIQLRKPEGTQKEHRVIADMCRDAIGEVFPLIKELT